MTITLPPKQAARVTRRGEEKKRIRSIWRQARDILRVSRHDPRRDKLKTIMREAARYRRAMMLPRKWATL
jgi:hypothetical protein